MIFWRFFVFLWCGSLSVFASSSSPREGFDLFGERETASTRQISPRSGDCIIQVDVFDSSSEKKEDTSQDNTVSGKQARSGSDAPSLIETDHQLRQTSLYHHSLPGHDALMEEIRMRDRIHEYVPIVVTGLGLLIGPAIEIYLLLTSEEIPPSYIPFGYISVFLRGSPLVVCFGSACCDTFLTSLKQ